MEDTTKARFDPGCLPFFWLLPIIVSVLVGLCLLPVPQSCRPNWLRKFAAEADAEDIKGINAGRHRSWNHWTAFLTALAAIGLLTSVIHSLTFSQNSLVALFVFPWVCMPHCDRVTAYKKQAIALLITLTRRPRATPFSLLVLYLVLLSCQVIVWSSEYESRSSIATQLLAAEFCLAAVCITMILVMPMRDPNWSFVGIGSSKHPPTSDLVSPEDNISLLQWMTVFWMSPLIRLGSQRQIHDQDVWFLPFEFQHTRLHLLFRDLKGSVLVRLLKANSIDLIIVVVLGVFELLLQFSAPVLLQQLLRAIEDSRTRPAIIYAILTGVTRLIKTQSGIFSLWFARRCYERSRGEMITMIYEKTLNRKVFSSPTEIPEEKHQEQENPTKRSRLHMMVRSLSKILRLDAIQRLLQIQQHTQQNKSPASMGKILNLMKNDVYEVAQRFWEFESLFTKPLTLILSVILIWQLLGWSCLIGVACVLIAQLLNIFFVRILVRLEKLRRTVTDTRLNISSQYVESIRHLRWYDWQESWLGRALEVRKNELHLRIVTGLWMACTVVFSNALSSSLFPVVAFAAYTLITRQPLTVDIAFPAIQLFTILDSALRNVPKLITVLLNASVALGRINDFMAEANKEDANSTVHSTDLTIQLEAASFAWPGVDKNILENVNVRFEVGFTVICGRVGQGKTALLQAILGELDQKSGNVYRPDEMFGYCTQLPWLQSMSIRENILFTSSYDEDRYKQTLEACALIPDLASFEHGDLSNIGENGIGLSGGQKARVALARAVYSRAKILLLDDPLAALDHDTATHIVKKLFQGPLAKDRIVVLVTHRVDLVAPLADDIWEVHDSGVRHLDSGSIETQNQGFSTHPPNSVENEAPSKEADDERNAIPDEFIEEEHRAQGGVMASVYWRYIKAGDLRLWAIMVVIILIQRFFRVADYYFLKEWGEAYERSAAVARADLVSGFFSWFPPPAINVRPWLIVYLSIALAKAVSSLAINVTLLAIVYVAGRQLFENILRRVSGARFRFYDTTPIGRLMNRLTSDFGTLDGGIGSKFSEIAWCAISWVTAMIVIASTTPIFLIFSILLTATFVYIFMQFLPLSQNLRRLEMVSLTPLMSNFGILLEGLSTVRAFRAQSQFQSKIIAVTDTFQKMDHFYWSLQAWLMYRLDLIAAVSTFCLTLLALYENLSPGLTAFVLITASGFVSNTHALCRYYGSLQMDFVSVERIVELLDLEQEDTGDIMPPAAWPSSRDDIVFDQVTLKYAENLPPALEDVTFHIPGGSTTAIIGRTGSGKSTLALALLATIRPSADNGGSIKIGSMDLSRVDVHALRQRITFVAQDPVLFPGTLRQNLDPTNSYTTAQCEVVLEQILKTTRSVATTSASSVATTQNHTELSLVTNIATGGKNLSQGQRQLVGLGRAILRRSPIVILDEATASIDSTTAADVQRILREELQESTVIMIAHRVEAVQAANWAIALDKGKVAHVGPADEVIARRFTEQTAAKE